MASITSARVSFRCTKGLGLGRHVVHVAPPFVVGPRPALADEISRARALDQAEVVAAGIKVRDLRAERDGLDRELAEVEHLVKLHRRTLPGTLIPISAYAAFDRLADAITANERALADCASMLAPHVEIPTAEQDRAEREQAAAAAKKAATTAAAVERIRTEARREAYVASGAIERIIAYPTPSAVADLVAAASRPAPLGPTPSDSVLAMARADVNHPLHRTSQRVLYRGRPAQIFTGV